MSIRMSVAKHERLSALGCDSLPAMKILIVDDDADMRKTVADIFAESRLRIVTARNGTIALQCLDTFVPDVVITDIYMPRMDGIEMIRSMRQKHPDIGILAMTGGCEAYADIGLEPVTPDMIYALGADIMLRKRFREDERCDAICLAARRI